MNPLYFALVILAAAQVGSAIKCYECASHIDPICSDLFHEDSTAVIDSYLKDCPEKPGMSAFCRKLDQDLFTKNKDYETRVRRDCGYKTRGDGPSCYQIRSDEYLGTTCQCFEDGCNGSNFLYASSMLAILVPLIARLF